MIHVAQRQCLGARMVGCIGVKGEGEVWRGEGKARWGEVREVVESHLSHEEEEEGEDDRVRWGEGWSEVR